MFAAVATLIAIAGCAHGNWSAYARKQADAMFVGHSFALRRSYYFAQMYDDNERWLLCERASASTSHRTLPGQGPLHPPPEEGIVAAGTPVILERLEFPTALSALHRMGNAPRRHIWLRLRPTSNALIVTPHASRALTIVLDEDVVDFARLGRAIEERLGPVAEVERSLRALPPPLLTAVLRKQVVLDMDEATLLAALGEPDRRLPLARGQGCVQWTYDLQWVELCGGKVTHIGAAQ